VRRSIQLMPTMDLLFDLIDLGASDDCSGPSRLGWTDWGRGDRVSPKFRSKGLEGHGYAMDRSPVNLDRACHLFRLSFAEAFPDPRITSGDTQGAADVASRSASSNAQSFGLGRAVIPRVLRGMTRLEGSGRRATSIPSRDAFAGRRTSHLSPLSRWERGVAPPVRSESANPRDRRSGHDPHPGPLPGGAGGRSPASSA
jgi:hypothetical protein